MLGITGGAKVFLCQVPVNLRKSFEGLSKIATEQINEKLISNSFYVCKRRFQRC